MNLKYAKQALIDFQEEHESYLDASQKYKKYQNLPFWKKWVTKTIEPPHRDYLYRNYTVCRSPRGHLVIELRMYYSGENKEITLALNEGNHGYKVNIDTGEKSYYLGKVNPNISIYAEELLEHIRKELAAFYL